MIAEPVEIRFWRLVERHGANECWPFQGHRDKRGYGRFNPNRNGIKQRNAQRVAFYLTRGYWPKVARHTCDNPPCCNPAHVVDGTHADNVRDKVERGRQRLGAKCAHARLTEDAVRDIRQKRQSLTVLARKYGVGKTTILSARQRVTWKHVS